MYISNYKDRFTGSEIAIIGMAGRFPGAKNIDEFWGNLKNGVESISFFPKEEAEMSPFDNPDFKSPNYVGAAGLLDDIELFDANYFGYSPREAQIMDPQQRIMLECACEALEDAGCDPDSYEGLMGVYVGSGINTYFLNNIFSNRGLYEKFGAYNIMIGNNKDLIPMLLSYKLNLRGPCVNVQSACSTSLVAIHQACQSLLGNECDIAIAGGITVKVPQKSGYVYEEGMILSPDGHCRAFDAKADGTIFSNGVGVVVLKRLQDAINDGDCIHAVIKGSAVNNDGALRVGFTAPGVTGQAEVIAEAMGVAGVTPENIGYIEAHGTGTEMGDPIEITALTKVFKSGTAKKNFCPIGSVKTNIGHLDVAAGIAGLIKTVLALKYGLIPPSLHFEKSSEKINFKESPFFVNSRLLEWKASHMPRTAGVSSFGFGGTNAHVILEEAPLIMNRSVSRRKQILVFSAKTKTALQKMTNNFVEHIKAKQDVNLADAAYTLQMGRKKFGYRKFIVAGSIDETVNELVSEKPGNGYEGFVEETDRPIYYMFPGQGSQYAGMTLGLYKEEPEFKKNVDLCADILQRYLGTDIREILYPADDKAEETKAEIKKTEFAQPAIFAIEYSLAKLFEKWGIRPKAMIGHSIGELVAATIAGVFSIECALAIVAKRGKLMGSLPGGAMTSVSLKREEIEAIAQGAVNIASVNSPSLCVVSGAFEEIEKLEMVLEGKNISYSRLHTSHAFHSKMMDPILEEFKSELTKYKLNAPKIPFVSNVTGRWISEKEAASPDYWMEHLRQPVLFSDGIKVLLEDKKNLMLEVGPGNTLCTLVKQNPENQNSHLLISSVRHPKVEADDTSFILNTLGKLWVEGCRINWKGFYEGQKRYRISLPAYPFEKKRYWIEPLKNVRFPVNEKTEAESKVELHSMQNGWEITDAHLRMELAGKYEAPSNSVEEVIVDMWREYLGIEKIGINDNFFELGGNSLLATQIVSRIRKVFQIDIPLKEIFENPTVKAVADKIVDLWGGFDAAEEIAAVFKEIQVLSDDEINKMRDKENSK